MAANQIQSPESEDLESASVDLDCSVTRAVGAAHSGCLAPAVSTAVSVVTCTPAPESTVGQVVVPKHEDPVASLCPEMLTSPTFWPEPLPFADAIEEFNPQEFY